MANEAKQKNEAATVQTSKTVSSAPTYTVEEFAAAPQTLDVKSADIIRAAFKVANKETATVEEAKKIVNNFKNKEVK